ncbi:MAG TPA: hypothetical protein DEA71_09850 [Nitrospira sp.]|nr:hypothetical protein [Nitrospira sp.]
MRSLDNKAAPGYFDLQALATYSCTSVRWLRNRLVDRNHPLPCYRIEGKILVKREEFDRWIARHRVSNCTDNLSELVDAVVSQVQAPNLRRLTERA